MSRLIAAAFFLLFSSPVLLLSAPSPKNVILIVGDGMGPAHFTACRMIRGADFQIGRIRTIGMATTFAADRNVTDSAASATALATGVKTNYEVVSLDPAGKPQATVLEVAEGKQKLTGLVTTAYFYDATPATFAAHASHRGQHHQIINQMLQSGSDLIVGTAGSAFEKDEFPSVEAKAAETGYAVVTDVAAIRSSPSSKVLAIFPSQPRDVDFPGAPLPELAAAAIERLEKGRNGFFLLIEHEGTDSSSHQNHAADLAASLASFDKAVGVALDFAAKRGDTLVVVTGDHETGGVRVSETRAGRFRIEWSTSDHTAVAVPVFAFGPGAEAFAGFMDNTDVGMKLIAAVGGK